MDEKIKIAIIGGSSGDALVEACMDLGHYSILICGNKDDNGYGDADENYLIDLLEKEKIVNLIKDKADCLLLGTGHELAHNIAKDVYDVGIVTSINPYKAEYGKNKILAYNLIRKLGFNTPDYFVVSSVKELDSLDIQLPYVVKSENDSVETAKANNKEELYRLVSENTLANSKAIVEQFIEGTEYTIPIISDGENYRALTDALKMDNIKKIAIAKLRNFNVLDIESDNIIFLDEELIEQIVYVTTEVTRAMQLTGVPRYDLIVDNNRKIHILEVNEVSVSRNGEGHYPWEDVNIEYAKEMVKNTVLMHEKRKK